MKIFPVAEESVTNGHFVDSEIKNIYRPPLSLFPPVKKISCAN